MPSKIPLNIPSDFIALQSVRIADSYRKWTSCELVPLEKDSLKLAEKLFFAPFVIATSNNAADPVLTYGNQAALELWEMPWGKFTSTPGKHTAEPMHRDERQRFLDEVQKNGFINDYSGIRISSSGRRFRIKQATVWNLTDSSGVFWGQAATFKDWEWL